MRNFVRLLHSYDKQTYINAIVLFDFCQAIPLSRQPHLLELVISRLQDKSSIVRKNAIQLLKTCLIYNPFGAQVSNFIII